MLCFAEQTDPAKLCKPFVDIVPDYPIPAFRPNSNRFLHHEYQNILSPILPSINTLYDFPVSFEVIYLDVFSARRQRIIFSKYHNFFLSLYNHSDFVKMHMHKARLLKETVLTINLPSDYFTEPKYLFMFCGTLKLIEHCDSRDANTFDYHSFLFATSYLMIKDLFMLQILKGSGPVSFRLNDTILPTLYVLLNLEFDLPCSLSWFESCFKFFNHDFVCGIKHSTISSVRRSFLNFERHNERYQEHFFNHFHGHSHCTKTCEICIEHDSSHFSRVNYELSRFKAS